MPTLSIILVNYKGADDTIACVRSIERSSFTDYDIIIVDNASNDGSVPLLRKECPRATLITNALNLGFAGGNNVGIREALLRSSALILLLNNDTVVNADTLQSLVRTVDEHPGAGVVGGKIYYYDRPSVIWFAGGFFHDDAAFGGHYGLGDENHGKHDTLRTCDYVTGCCLLMRREVIDRVGILEGAYFAYLEDADFCCRARRASYAIMYQPKAVVYHKVSRTSSWDSPVYIYFNLRNKLIYLRRNSSVKRWLPHLPRLVYFYVRQFVRLVFKWRDPARVRAAWYGLVDGLCNNTGEYGEGRLSKLSSSTRT